MRQVTENINLWERLRPTPYPQGDGAPSNLTLQNGLNQNK